jgi:hypothetical protein
LLAPQVVVDRAVWLCLSGQCLSCASVRGPSECVEASLSQFDKPSRTDSVDGAVVPYE